MPSATGIFLRLTPCPQMISAAINRFLNAHGLACLGLEPTAHAWIFHLLLSESTAALRACALFSYVLWRSIFKKDADAVNSNRQCVDDAQP